MRKTLMTLLGVLLASPLLGAEALIVADEFPAMEVLARRMQAQIGWTSRLVAQTNLPTDLAPFTTVIVYIHGNLKASVEEALIHYTEAGGKLLVLHHSISSGKRVNRDWFRFLGVDLPKGDVSQGGYKWIEGVTLEVVNRANHFITTNQVSYTARTVFTAPEPATATDCPSFTLHETEVYLNHVPTRPKTILLGFKYTEAKTGQTWMQDRAGWLAPAGRGWIFYFMPGHSAKDFQHEAYVRILLNALLCRL